MVVVEKRVLVPSAEWLALGDNRVRAPGGGSAQWEGGEHFIACRHGGDCGFVGGGQRACRMGGVGLTEADRDVAFSLEDDCWVRREAIGGINEALLVRRRTVKWVAPADYLGWDG